MKKVETELKIKCAWCGLDMGVKNGQGVTGTTSTICPACAKKEWAKIGGRPPARWNLVGRLLYRIRGRRRYVANLEKERATLTEIDRQVDQRAEVEDIFVRNPGLHARVVLEGKPGVHYIDNRDFIRLEAALDQTHTNYRWN